MIPDPSARRWQRAIIADAERKLGRKLAAREREFVTSREGFVALEMIHDTVRAAGREELESYMNSESRRDR